MQEHVIRLAGGPAALVVVEVECPTRVFVANGDHGGAARLDRWLDDRPTYGLRSRWRRSTRTRSGRRRGVASSHASEA